MLERLMPPLGDRTTRQEGLRSVSTRENKVWKSYRYKAHNEDFSEILWPEKFTQERLENERRDYVEQGYPEGYAQEYLNYPIDDSTAYFKLDDFRNTFDISELDVPLNYYSAIDLAISQRERADFTAIATVGVDSKNNIYVVDMRRGRWDAKEIIDNMLQVQRRYGPDLFTVEKGSIERAIGPFLRDTMQEQNVYLNLNLLNPGQDKQSRARSIQARLRQGAVYFDTSLSWYDAFMDEMRTFPRGAHDDMVDAFSWIGLTLDKQTEAPTQSEWDDEQWEEEMGSFSFHTGRCAATGY
jgi:predicted phage terminase large subunit-like protein